MEKLNGLGVPCNPANIVCMQCKALISLEYETRITYYCLRHKANIAIPEIVSCRDYIHDDGEEA